MPKPHRSAARRSLPSTSLADEEGGGSLTAPLLACDVYRWLLNQRTLAPLVARLSLVTLLAGLVEAALVSRLTLVSPLAWGDSGEGRRDGRQGNSRCEEQRQYPLHDSPPFPNSASCWAYPTLVGVALSHMVFSFTAPGHPRWQDRKPRPPSRSSCSGGQGGAALPSSPRRSVRSPPG